MQIWPNLADILSADISACISADKIGRYDYRSYSTIIPMMSNLTMDPNLTIVFTQPPKSTLTIMSNITDL